jgi:hypothetical protein
LPPLCRAASPPALAASEPGSSVAPARAGPEALPGPGPTLPVPPGLPAGRPPAPAPSEARNTRVSWRVARRCPVLRRPICCSPCRHLALCSGVTGPGLAASPTRRPTLGGGGTH